MEDEDLRMEIATMWTDALWLNQHPEGLNPQARVPHIPVPEDEHRDSPSAASQNVLEYFLLSSFVDPRCMNIVARDRGYSTEAEDPRFAIPKRYRHRLVFPQVLKIAPAIEYSLAYAQVGSGSLGASTLCHTMLTTLFLMAARDTAVRGFALHHRAPQA